MGASLPTRCWAASPAAPNAPAIMDRREAPDLVRNMTNLLYQGWGLAGSLSNWQAISLSCPRPSRPGEFHPEPLTDPDLNLSIHPARVTARRLPPSADVLGSSRCDPVGPSQRR